MNIDGILKKGRWGNAAEYDRAEALLLQLAEHARDERDRLQRVSLRGTTKKPSARVRAARADLENAELWFAACRERIHAMVRRTHG